MPQQIAHVALVVRDYDEAIDFYVHKLGFQLLQDTPLSDTKRWVLVAPKDTTGTALLLAKAANARQISCIGNQTGGRVFLFLYTDNFWQDYERMIGQGITFVRPPVEELYGIVAVFEDLYGNQWDLLQRHESIKNA